MGKGMSEVLSLMLQAKGSEHGVEIQTNDSELFQRRFHQARNKHRAEGGYTFDSLRCRIISPNIVFLINEENDEAGNREGNDPGIQG